MSVYLRTSRNTGISLPWWLALPVGAVWLMVWIVVGIYWVSWQMVLLAVRGVNAGHDAWQRRRASG